MHSTRSRHARAALATAILILLAGCGGSTGPSASGEASSAPSVAVVASTPPSPTATAAPSPSPSPSPAAITLCGKERTACPVAAGTYYSAVFKPSFNITIADGWSNDWNFPRIGLFGNQPGSFVWMTQVFAADDSLQIIQVAHDPAGIVAFLRKRPGISVGPETPVTIDGASGLQVDVTASRRINVILGANPTAPQVQANSKARYVIVDRNGSTVVFIAMADKVADFDAIMAQAQPMLDSITWR
jgi:hypothetical protein